MSLNESDCAQQTPPNPSIPLTIRRAVMVVNKTVLNIDTSSHCCFPDCRQPVSPMETHNAEPCMHGRCSSQCNAQRVIPARIDMLRTR
jgi:hypothetical protein